MRFRTAVVLLPLLVACAERRVALAPGDIWIRDVTVVSLERATPLRGAHVVVRGDRIVWIGSAPRSTDGVQVIDGAGRYLLPGLIDGHVHLGAPPPGLPASVARERPTLVTAYEAQLPRSFLYHGFTTVVELGVKDRAALDRIRAHALAPTVIDCGDPLVIANGFPMPQRTGVAERLRGFPNFLHDPAQASTIPPEFPPERHSPAAAVARVRDGGGRCVKAFYEPGDPRAPFPLPTASMVRTAIDSARAARLPLLLHANSLAAHHFAAEVAPDAVAHGLWSWPGLISLPPGDPLPDSLLREVRTLLDAQRAAKVAYMPTLRVIDGLIDLDGPAFVEDPRLARVVPPALAAWYASADGRAAAAEDNPGGVVTTILRSAAALGRHALAHVAAGGGRVLFGSDSPSGGGYGNPPGLNGYLELLAMGAAGLSPRQVLTAATLENARFFGIAEEVGTIEVGRRADLLLLDRDPLESLDALEAIRTVIVRGRAVARDSLVARE